ncbi:hypothetical protein FDZ71_00440 [bacterium]|nr:MAG: hypothetical protein FDZ71_00440 [bacterium]
MKDQFKLTIPAAKKSAGWKPVTVSADLVDYLADLSAETRISKNQIATQMIRFALERLILVDEEE